MDADGSNAIAYGTPAITVGANASGTVRYLEHPQDVLDLLNTGDVADTIVLSRGGTVTFVGAVLQEQPAGILTIEGAPQSHLGILAREFGIRAIMSIELVDQSVERLNPGGGVADEYVAHVARSLAGRRVVIDCSDPGRGVVLEAD